MNKLIVYTLLLGSLHTIPSQAQKDTVAVTSAAVVTDTLTANPAPAVIPAYKDRSFSNRFQEKYTGTEFQYENKTKAKSQWERTIEALGRFISDIFSFGDATKETSGFTIFMRVLAFVIIGSAIYMIARALLNKEGLWIFGRARKSFNVQDITEEDIRQMNFKELIESTKNDNNYKLAVRYYYLWLLKKLSVNEIIAWHWDKTNTDYLYEIKSSTLKKDFEYLSYLYDYSWYGDFPLDKKAFAKAEKAFLKTINTL